MKDNCEKHDTHAFNTEENCKDCEKLEYCDAKLGKKLFFVPHCSCSINQGKADAFLEQRVPEVREREVVRVQEDVKIWSTKLLHKIHLDMDMSDHEAERFTQMQST